MNVIVALAEKPKHERHLNKSNQDDEVLISPLESTSGLLWRFTMTRSDCVGRNMQNLRFMSVLFAVVSMTEAAFVSIRGHAAPQRLPQASVRSWPSYTYDMFPMFGDAELERVPDPLGEDDECWTNSNTFSELFLPADLPAPQYVPALGICVAQGVPRYVMPSCLLYLETPEGRWRNRGLNTLPRATAWVDTFSEFGSTSLHLLELSAFIQGAPNVKFLEDQDGASNWQCLLSNMAGGTAGGIVDDVTSTIPVKPLYDEFLKRMKEDPVLFKQLENGYSFVDIPLPMVGDHRVPLKLSAMDYRTGKMDINPDSSKFIPSPISFPPTLCRMYLSDFEDPKRLLQFDNLAAGQLDPATGSGDTSGQFQLGGEPTAMLDGEPCGELTIQPVKVAAGGTSEFLPEVYRSLFEEGNILF